MPYLTSTDEHAVEIANLKSLEALVKERMVAQGNRGAAEDEWTLRENTESFNRKTIVPRVLRGIDSADLSTSIFGIPLKTPIIQEDTNYSSACCRSRFGAHGRRS